MDKIFKRFTCLILALLMVLEVFSPIAVAAAGLLDEAEVKNSTTTNQEKLTDELFEKKSSNTEEKKQKDTRTEYEKSDKFLQPAKKKEDYELLVPAKKSPKKQNTNLEAPEEDKLEEEKKLQEEKAQEEKKKEEQAKLEQEKLEALKIEAAKQEAAARANERESLEAEAEYREARDKRIELEKKLEELKKQKGLIDQEKKSENSLNSEESNKLNKKENIEEQVVEEEEKGFLEKLKEGLGLTDLQRADKELKKALANKKNGLEEIQALLNTFQDKYDLSREDQEKLMADNTDAFREFIERHGYENFDPQMFMIENDAAGENDGLEISDLYENLIKEDRELTIEEMEAGLQKAEMPNSEDTGFGFFRALRASSPLDGKKFTIRTRFDTSTSNGPIKAGQYFDIHLDEKLTVIDSATLKDIVYNNQIIATPEYDATSNTIRYKIVKDINENLNFPLNIDVDFNTGKITPDESFTVINSVSGLGVTNPKSLLPVVVDKNGNTVNTITEPGRKDVIQIIDPAGGQYRVPVDLVGEPVIENKEMVGINWSMKVRSDTDLSALGFMANFTTVKGSGLGEITDVKLNGKDLALTNNSIVKGTGIVDSKYHELGESTRDLSYTFYTPVTNKQGNYVIDISVILKAKGKSGAVRFILDEGYSQEIIREKTPTRVGVNNRTTIQGQFLANDKAQWTITDGISSGDEANNGMPLADRNLEGDQTVTAGRSVVYGIDNDTNSPTYGQMIVKEAEKAINSIPAKESDPSGTQEVGNIAVYELDTKLDNADKPNNYNISGVRITKFRDLFVDQVWNFPVDGLKMPKETITAKDNDGKEIGKVEVEEGADGKTQRLITIPNARFWDIDETKHEASKRSYKIEQKFNPETIEKDGKKYKYNENANYYLEDKKIHFIHNSAIEETNLKQVSFTVVKVDSKDPSKKLSGATFKLLGSNETEIVTDAQGRATFLNVNPGNYQLIEEKAPAGYKLDQSIKTVSISQDGEISVNGGNVQIGGSSSETKLVQHDRAPNWPDYMNAMHYGKINDNGEVEFYLYLKPQSDNGGGGTNRNTRLNISIPGVIVTDVKAYDVSPGYRQNVKYSMEQQEADGYIPLLGNNVIGAANNHKIIGTPNKVDAYTGKTGYQIYFPQERFANDWGFLVKVKANIGNKDSINLDYDWLTDKDTANQTNLTQKVTLSKASGEGDGSQEKQILVTNEEFTKSPITVTKFGDTFDENGNRNRLPGAEFVLKDSEGNVIANKFTDGNGTADFGKFPVGRYRLEEVQAPEGYIKSDVYFEVVVDEQGQVTYTARFEDGIGTPQVGRDYYIEKGEETGTSNKATVTNVNQRLEYLENEPGDIGVKTGVWEAYSYESLKYHADITLSNSAPNSRFEIQFDRNLDFTQYFSEFPKIVIDGVEVADPYFDYDTNLLTYVFNEKSKGGQATASINLRGIIPDKYYAKETGKYPFTIKVAPGVPNVGGNPVLNETINADYGQHHSQTGNSNQSYYFRDVYKKEDGKWYVTVLTYLNPLGLNYSAKTVKYNWITTDFQSNRIAEWSGKGYEPLYELNDVKVYATDYGTYELENGVKVNYYMPLSMGIRPEQEPNIYHLLAHQSIDPGQNLNIRENDVTITYNKDQIKTSNKLSANSPLIVRTPSPRNNGGFVIEQTFKITDIEQFNKKWRAFLMNDGNLTSAFASKANVNTAIGDQAGGEIPKYYREVIGLINNKYKPGSFKLTKYDEVDRNKKLSNATFALTDENGKTIYRTSDENGVVNFENIAPGRYTLEESRAPEGYQLTNKKWQVTILSNGSVTIRETSITGAGQLYTGEEINIQVSNKPAGQKFRVYKKDGNGQPLPGAKFRISDPENKDPNFPIEATSDENGVVQFNGTPKENKNYVLEEVEPPAGYNKLGKKWVLRVENGKVKIYNYSTNAEGGQKVQSILAKDGVEWVDVKNRNTSNWSNYDNRWTGWTGNNQDARYLGTRIIAINKKENYVIQRYVINPESRNIPNQTSVSIHRQFPQDPNMDWFDMTKFDKDNDIKVFKLDRSVTGLISDIRLASYNTEDITDGVVKSAQKEDGRYGEPNRLKLDIPKTDKPIVIDIKVPYKDANGGVGTGMDWSENNNIIYWKGDHYERVSDIKTSGPTTSTSGTIIGSYVGENSLDVTNDIKTYGFKIKKVKDDKKTAIPGAVFKLIGPDPNKDERSETTADDGTLSFSRLKPGKYTLVEETPAPGYEKANTTWTIRVTNDGKVYIKDNKTNTEGKESNAQFSVVANLNTENANVNPALAMKMQTIKASTYNFTNESVGNSPLFLNEADKRENSVINKIDAIYGENNFERLFPNGITIREVAMASYDPNIVGEKAEATAANEDGLEISPETNPEAQRAGDRWEIVDNASSTQPTKREDASDSEFGQLIDTKIIEIDKANNRYKQVFIFREGYAKKNRNIKFHRAYDNYNISPSEVTTRVFQVPTNTNLANINKSSDIDAIAGKTDISKNIRFTAEGTKKIQTTNINTKYPGTILIEVETNYNENYPIGLGSNYDFNTGSQSAYGHKCWLEKSYANEAGVPVVKTSVDYTINFDGNGGTWHMDPVTVEENTVYELPESSFKAPEGKEFDGWLVDGQKKNPGDKITVTSDLTITAQWRQKAPEQVTVSFNAGEGSGTMAEQKVNVGSNYQLPANGFTAPNGKEFDVWSVNGVRKNPGDSITVNADTKVTALWKVKAPKTYNVRVQNPQEGGAITSEPTSATAGTQINLTVTANEGFEIQRITMNGETLTADNNGNYSFTMPEGDATVSATFKKVEEQPGADETEIPAGSAAQITNKQVGLDLKIYKKDRNDRKLEGALFNIRKTDEKFEKFDDEFGVKTGASNKDGLVEFKDGDKIINLQKGYYIIEETAAPLGYRKPNAPWKVQVVEENGQLVAKYKGPEETPQSFVEKNNSEDISIKEANGVKYATKITHIDTESRTFIQRVYIDTRDKNGVVNVQIKPKHKREEIDRAGLPPVTIKEGVKTAYRSTYKISGINGNPDQAQMIKILNDYDVSTPNVTVVNTARWRPFDWGFDEDQLNLEPGVYYIDIEGFYDTSIIDRNVTNEVLINGNYNFTDKAGKQTDDPVLKDPYKLTAADIPDEDLGKIDIDIEFFDGAREFYQAKDYNKNTGQFDYETFKGASYQDGMTARKKMLTDFYGENFANNWANKKPEGQKYINALSKQAMYNYISQGSLHSDKHIAGYIYPPVDPNKKGYVAPSSTISTSMDISPLYSSNATNTVPQEGLSVVNDAERYNITFSKHGKNSDKDSIEEITKRRLEGAVFKLEKRVREGIYEEVEGSYVSSAFNGYFGFRGLEPGRYRLVEVQAPKGYKPIDGPLLYFSVETVSLVSQKIVDPRIGETIDVNTVEFYFPNNTTPYKFKDLEVHDPVTNKPIKFMDAKNVDLESTKIINPQNKAIEVPLKDLSIKFPGEIKNKEGEVIKDTYLISEIQITPTSNGYISLEYNKANGVYQYIPEKSTTEENGLLVDYVTSATAKNMGKIVNEKPGKGSVTINKVDENGAALKGTANEKGELIAGAKFRLTNLTDNSKPIEKTVGTDGKLTFDGLKIGNYQLEEIESPDGHINNGQVWHFTVGGEGLDPYSGDIAPTGRDLSGQIKLTESKMSVVSPINENGAPTVEGEIHPHLGESLVFDNSYDVPEGIKINPGDYFTLELKKSTDLHGVFENSIDNLDIFADGVGTIAKANYNREAGTITYTFTKYADTYELKKISNKIAAFINLDVIRQSQNFVDVGFTMKNEDKSSKVNVVYDLNTERKDDRVNFINYTSKIVKYNPQTGEFVHYFYINRDRKPLGAFDFNFLSDQNIENVVVTEYKVLNNLRDAMPESFGVDENSNDLSYGRVINSSNYLPAGKLLSTPYYYGVTSDGSYIVKVTGKVSDKDKSRYVGYSHIIHYYGNGYSLYADRFDAVHQFVNESSAEAKLTIKAINPSNKIMFKKINSNSEALQGATFQLYKNDTKGNWNSYGQPITTKEDGLIEYSKLPKGEYQLRETTAPEGYVLPDGPLAEFKIDESGKVFRKESYKDENGKDQVRFVEEPGVVPITLVNNKEHEVEFKKVDGTDKTKVLEGAEFEVLYKKEKTGEYSNKDIVLYKDAKGTLYALKSDDKVPTGYTKLDKFTSDKNGLVKFKVYESGYYALKEVKAPSGYINPRGIVKEFAVLDNKVQTEQYMTEMDVDKTTSHSMANDVFQKSYATNMTLRINPNHEDITYVKDKSTITLSDLPLKAEIWDNKFNGKQAMSITAYLVDNDNKETVKKTYDLDLTKDYNSGTKATKTIDLYSLVKELEDQSADGDIRSNKTLVLTMSSSLYLDSELDINSNIVIGDEIKEKRTFHVGTKGDDYVDHSYSFTTMDELTDIETNPMEVENYKGEFPITGGLGTIIFTITGLVIMSAAAYLYKRKRNVSYDE